MKDDHALLDETPAADAVVSRLLGCYHAARDAFG